jgi:signal peptidase II
MGHDEDLCGNVLSGDQRSLVRGRYHAGTARILNSWIVQHWPGSCAAAVRRCGLVMSGVRYMAWRAAARQAAPRFRPAGARIAAKPAAWSAVVAVLGVVTDVASKAWALSRLSGGRDITTAGGLIRLQLVINHGAAFGLAAGYEPILVVVAFAGVIVLGTWAVRASGQAEGLGAALAASGAAGNLIDRLARPPGVLHGGVVDWLHVWFYGPTFNLADIWLRAGVLIAIGGWLWRRQTHGAGH